jgi:hypothetical protein
MGARGGFSEAFCGMYTEFQETLEKLLLAPIWLKNSCEILHQECSGKFVIIQNNLARRQKRTVN